MGTYTDVNHFPDVYRLDTTDQVLGGTSGIANLQAKQLADRTGYLKTRVLAGHSAVGLHNAGVILSSLVGLLNNSHFASNAAIAESKLLLTLVGKTRPSSRGTYATTTELATDIVDLAAGVVGVGDDIAAYVHSSQLDPHNVNADAHATIKAWANSLLTFSKDMGKTILYNKLFKQCIGAYTGGFVTNCYDTTDVSSGLSSGYTFNLEGTFRPVASGMTLVFPTPAALALSANPLSAKAVLAIEAITAEATLAADLVVSISKDDGTTWASGVLGTVEQYSATKYFMSWNVASLPATDTRNLAIKITSTAGKDFKIHAAACFV